MDSERLHIYSDASFSKAREMGVAGWLMFRNEENHKAGKVLPKLIRTVKMKETNNIRVEIRGVLLALKEAGQEGGREIHLYTDCQTITGLLGRRENLETSDYISRRKKRALSNAELYREFFSICDLLHPKIHRVKGHSPKTQRSLEQRNFSIIDQIVRKELRAV